MWSNRWREPRFEGRIDPETESELLGRLLDAWAVQATFALTEQQSITDRTQTVAREMAMA